MHDHTARPRSIPSLALVALLGACGGPTHWIEDTAQFEFEPATVAHLRSETHNGSLHATVDPTADRVRVVARIRAGGLSEEDAQRALAAIDVRCAVEADALVLGSGWKTADPDDSWGRSVSFDVTLPRAVPVTASSHNGDIEVVATDRVTATTHNGALRVSGDATHVTAESHNGGIEVSGKLANLDVTSHNGAVRVRSSASGPVEGSVRTHNGGVLVELAPDADVTIDASTSNGGIVGDAALTEVHRSERALTGRLGAGSGRLRVSTSNGGITVRTRAGR